MLSLPGVPHGSCRCATGATHRRPLLTVDDISRNRSVRSLAMREENSQDVPNDFAPRTIRVLHLVSIETTNYYLNNLFDHSDRAEIEMSVVTLGHSGSLIEDFQGRGAYAQALNCNARSRYFEAHRQLRRT